MKNIIKFAIILWMLLQVGGHSSKTIWPSEEIDWDIAHPLPVITKYKFGWPVPAIMIDHIQGCTTALYLETEYVVWGFVYDVFWLFIVIKILDLVGVDQNRN